MFRYHIKTVWEISAPLESVYELISDSSNWNKWWPDLQESFLVSADRNDGINSVWHYVWRTHYLCKLDMNMRVIEIEDLTRIVALATGDLEGKGIWEFSSLGKNTVVMHDWDVVTTRWWMRLLSPFFHRVFEANHAQIMHSGGHGLASWLGAKLVRIEVIQMNV